MNKCCQCHWTVHFKMVNTMLCEFHFNLKKKPPWQSGEHIHRRVDMIRNSEVRVQAVHSSGNGNWEVVTDLNLRIFRKKTDWKWCEKGWLFSGISRLGRQNLGTARQFTIEQAVCQGRFAGIKLRSLFKRPVWTADKAPRDLNVW